MELERSFRATCSFDRAIAVLGDEATLVGLFPGETEILERAGDRITTATHYTALGQEGVAKFHFEYQMDGGIRFEKVCDGRVWKSLTGSVAVEDEGEEGCRVTLGLKGATKSLVPEFTIKGPMEDQIREMSQALEARLEDAV